MAPVVVGIGWDMVGALSAATFYVPLSKVKRWSWETMWTVAGLFSWVLLPLCVSASLLPNFWSFYTALDSRTILTAFVFGALWGVGNVSFGLTIRYLGVSLGIGTAIGITMVVGSVLPPILHGQAAHLVTTESGLCALAGIIVAVLGIGIVSFAGQLKEVKLGTAKQEFNLRKGLLLALLSGIFSSCMSLAIDAAAPIKAMALQVGVKPLYAGLPGYVIIMVGGALVNFGYCIARLAFKKDLSFRADMAQPAGALGANTLMAAIGGAMWYLQFFFLAWGAACIPVGIAYINWMLLMSGCVLFAGIAGLVLGEWRNVGAMPVRVLVLGLLVIILSANIVGIGATL